MTVIIPSRNASNLEQCVAALREHEPNVRIIVVDDGLKYVPLGVESIAGAQPFIYARNVNIGVRAAGKADIVVWNDDAILRTLGGLTALQRLHATDPRYAILGPVIDGGLPPAPGMLDPRYHNREDLLAVAIAEGKVVRGPGGGWMDAEYQTPIRTALPASTSPRIYTAPLYVPFCCAFIPRASIESVGLLDERFGVQAGDPLVRGYGCEDEDWCWRARAAGQLVGISDACHVDHHSLPSSYRNHTEPWKIDVSLHERLFELKWGIHPHSTNGYGLYLSGRIPAWDARYGGVDFDSVTGWLAEGNIARLEELIQKHDVRSVLELGTCYGRSAIWFALHPQIERVTCVDLWGGIPSAGVPSRVYEVFRENIRSLGVEHKIDVVIGNTRNPRVRASVSEADLCYVDGSHVYEDVKGDILDYGLLARSVLCGDDYAGLEPPHDGVPKAVDELLPERRVFGRFWWVER